MVIRGGIRGNGIQLAHYLLSGEANDNVQIVEVNGRLNATDKYLHQTMQGMALTAELTKSQKGLYHAQINPAYSEDRKMTNKDWSKAADILAHELGLSEQRRVIVLHTKKNRTHAHVVFERYDHQTGKVVANKFSRLAQDRARKEMERVFAHQPTPHRNKHRPELKEALTGLWHETTTGAEFIRAVHDNGYMVAEGVPRHPFMVVDENGRSFDLVRQLKDIRIKDVRQRMRHEKLIPEKEAIELMRQKQEGSTDANKAEQQRDNDKNKATRTVAAFWDNKQETTLEDTNAQSQRRMKDMADNFMESSQSMTKDTEKNNGLEKKKIQAREYFLNGDELTDKADDTIGNEHTNRLADNHAETEDSNVAKPQSDESRQRQQRVAEQFAANREETSKSGIEPDKKRYQEKLKEFILSEDELVEPVELLPEETLQYQQLAPKQSTEKETLITSELTEEQAIQKLILEQKEIRERYQQRAKKRVR